MLPLLTLVRRSRLVPPSTALLVLGLCAAGCYTPHPDSPRWDRFQPEMPSWWLEIPKHFKPYTLVAPDRGQLQADPGSIANVSYSGTDGGGANPSVQGRARFQGSLVRFDLMMVEAPPAQVKRVDLWWQSHVESAGLEPWSASPNDSYAMDPPKTRWYVWSIPATFDSSASHDCFHVRAQLFDFNNQSLGTVSQKWVFPPAGTTANPTDWNTAWPSP